MKNSSLGVRNDAIRTPGSGSALSGSSCRTRSREWGFIGDMAGDLFVVGERARGAPVEAGMGVLAEGLEDVAVGHLAAVDVQGERGAVGQGVRQHVVLEGRDQRAGGAGRSLHGAARLEAADALLLRHQLVADGL